MTVTVLLGQADGSLVTSTETTLPGQSYLDGATFGKSAITDLNGDGYVDLIGLDYAADGVAVLLGGANNTFGNKTIYAIGPTTADFALGDFNGDRRLDLAAVASDSSHGLIVLRNLTPPPADLIAAAVLSTHFDPTQSATRVTVAFSEPVVGLGLSDLIVNNTTTGQTFRGVQLAYVPGQLSATLTLPANLPDGNYTFRINAGVLTDVVGNPSATTFVNSNPSNFVLPGDLDRDRDTDFDDLVIMAKHHGKSGMSYVDGNIDYSADGSVNFNDLLLMAKSYGLTVVAPAAATIVDAIATRTRKTIVSDVL